MAGPRNASINAGHAANCECDECRMTMSYLSGFFDGEGSIYARNGLQVSAVQIDQRPLLLLQDTFGGVVRERGAGPSGKVCSAWVRYGKPAEDALRRMLPYLIVKLDQAVIAIQYSALVKSRAEAHPGRQVDDETKVERERLRRLIMAARTAHVARSESGELGRLHGRA